MRIKLYTIKFVEQCLMNYITRAMSGVNVWNLNVFAYKKSKYKEQINNIINHGDSISFQRKPVNSKKYGPDQQTIYSPFIEFYDVEMEDRELIRLVFEVPKE